LQRAADAHDAGKMDQSLFDSMMRDARAIVGKRTELLEGLWLFAPNPPAFK
jgi:hypothetical protein